MESRALPIGGRSHGAAQWREELWYKNAVIYGVDIDAFQDSDGDGVGDLPGITRRLDYLAELGVTCLWVLPFYRSPDRDNGYDISDYFHLDRRYGALDDLLDMVRAAGERGIRILLDLVVNHTSNEHPWFQASRRDPQSRYRDYYIWVDHPPPTPPGKGSIFPGQENTVWTFDEVAGKYYYHRFYHFEPELNLANPEVQGEIARIMDFWLSMGVSGFRVDAASHMIEAKGVEDARPARPHAVLKGLRQYVQDRHPSAALIGEADVTPDRVGAFFGEGDELNILFNFLLSNFLGLALARQDSEPVRRILNLLPTIPDEGQWANFLRNLDEWDLERLTDEEREDVFRAFAPEEEMRIFGRGIRRRLAPMLDGDPARLRMAYSLLFSMPGTPTLVYGDEIGMGDDLSLQGRSAVRTPMQWSAGKNAGFSDAAAGRLVRPVIDEGPFGFEDVNVEAQREDADSLLRWMQRLIQVRRESPEVGWGTASVLGTGEPGILAHRCEWMGAGMLFLHNLSDRAQSVELDLRGHETTRKPRPVFGGAEIEAVNDTVWRFDLEPYGYLWLRVSGQIQQVEVRVHR